MTNPALATEPFNHRHDAVGCLPGEFSYIQYAIQIQIPCRLLI
jgi:hypothetical protein